MFTHLKNILATIMLLFHSSAGFIVDYVNPCIKLVETIKFALGLDELDLSKFDIYKYIKETFNLETAFIAQMIAYFVDEVKELFPDIDKDFTDLQKEDYQNQILFHFIVVLRNMTQWQKDMFYLKICYTVLIKIAKLNGHELTANDSITLVQVAYAHNKLFQNF